MEAWPCHGDAAKSAAAADREPTATAPNAPMATAADGGGELGADSPEEERGEGARCAGARDDAGERDGNHGGDPVDDTGVDGAGDAAARGGEKAGGGMGGGDFIPWAWRPR